MGHHSAVNLVPSKDDFNTGSSPPCISPYRSVDLGITQSGSISLFWGCGKGKVGREEEMAETDYTKDTRQGEIESSRAEGDTGKKTRLEKGLRSRTVSHFPHCLPWLSTQIGNT